MVIWTALPIGEYAAVTLLLFFGIKSIKDAWDLPSNVVKSGDKSSPELDEYTEAEELVKEKVAYNSKLCLITMDLFIYKFILLTILKRFNCACIFTILIDAYERLNDVLQTVFWLCDDVSVPILEY